MNGRWCQAPRNGLRIRIQKFQALGRRGTLHLQL
jgi:hypothetical protein